MVTIYIICRPLLMIELDIDIINLVRWDQNLVITTGKDSAILWFSFRSLEINMLKVTLLISLQIFGLFGVLREKIGKHFITIDSKTSKRWSMKAYLKNVSKNGVCYCPCLKKGRTKTNMYGLSQNYRALLKSDIIIID